MVTRTRLILIAAVAALAIAPAAHAAGLRQVGTIAIPGEPINHFGSLAIDQATGLGYLADRDNKAVVVFDSKTDQYVSRITGFVGMGPDVNKAGPNGLVVVTGGEELWVSDGDSTIKIVDLKTNVITGSIATGGKSRANAMALDPVNRVVIVANSNDQPPFLSLIAVQGDHKILAKIPIADAAGAIERSAYHVPSGTFYTVIPVARADQKNGLLAQTDPKTGRLVQLHQIEGCHPHSLAVVSDTTIFMGCSSALGASPKPGGDLAIFDIPSGTLEGTGPGLGGNGDATADTRVGRYYHATSDGTLIVVDIKTRTLVQKIATSIGARSLAIGHSTDRIYLATTAKDGGCGGCIVVYAPQ